MVVKNDEKHDYKSTQDFAINYYYWVQTSTLFWRVTLSSPPIPFKSYHSSLLVPPLNPAWGLGSWERRKLPSVSGQSRPLMVCWCILRKKSNLRKPSFGNKYGKSESGT